MADANSSGSSSSSEPLRLVDLKLPPLNDQGINDQVRQTDCKLEIPVLRQPLLDSICRILKPATSLLDSELLDNEASLLTSYNETDNSILSEIILRLSKLGTFTGHRYLDIPTHLKKVLVNSGNPPCWYIREDFLRTHDLRTLAGHSYFMIPTLMMEEMVDEMNVCRALMELLNLQSNLSWKAKTKNLWTQTLDEINVFQASMDLLEFLSCLSWDAKAINIMGCFIFKFFEFFGFLLHGPNKRLTEKSSSVDEPKEKLVSNMQSSIKKFHLPICQLNNLIKLALQVIEYVSDLTLLSDTECHNEVLLSKSVHWVILSVVACYIHITLLIRNGKVALQLSNLISNLSHILKELELHYKNCTPQIEKMNANTEHIAILKYVLESKEPLPDIQMSELMKCFMCSEDGCHSLIDGSTMSEVNFEVLNEKAIIFFISHLEISDWLLKYVQEMYAKIKVDYYKFVWVPFVLKWTEELREKFEILKSKMPWYIICYHSPVAALWYIKGRWSGDRAFLLVDLKYGHYNPIPLADFINFYPVDDHRRKRPIMRVRIGGGGTPPIHLDAYGDYESDKQDTNQNSTDSAIKRLLANRQEVGQSYNLEEHSEEHTQTQSREEENVEQSII